MCLSSKIRRYLLPLLSILATLLLMEQGTALAISEKSERVLPLAEDKVKIPNNSVNSPTPLVLEKKIPLNWHQDSKAYLQRMPMSWVTITTLKFGQPGQTEQSLATVNHLNGAVKTGRLSWRITNKGTEVVDNSTGKVSNFSGMDSADVRAHEIVYNERLGIVWFYGQSVYRYHMGSHLLARLQPVKAELQGLRKLVAGTDGLWLAAKSGIYQLDETGDVLNKVMHPAIAGEEMINVVPAGNQLWFVSASAKLLRLRYVVSQKLDLAISQVISGGIPTEVISTQQSLWLLLGSKQGGYSKLAYVEQGSDQLVLLAGKYLSLRNVNGQLMASSYATSYKIDPLKQTITKLSLVIPGSLARASNHNSVLFIGTSYAFKDSCEIVERGVIDISKGWIQTLLGNTMLFR